MIKSKPLQLWDLWYPQAGATGISFARGRLAATNILIVHAPPASLTVEIRSDNGHRLAYGQDLAQTADRPMAILTRQGNLDQGRKEIAEEMRMDLSPALPKWEGRLLRDGLVIFHTKATFEADRNTIRPSVFTDRTDSL